MGGGVRRTPVSSLSRLWRHVGEERATTSQELQGTQCPQGKTRFWLEHRLEKFRLQRTLPMMDHEFQGTRPQEMRQKMGIDQGIGKSSRALE